MSVQQKVLPKEIMRFNRHQRYQHFLLALSVLMLVITGFPIKYGHWPWAQTVVNLFGSFQTMFMTHLVFAVVMLVSGAYHLAWMIGKFFRKELSMSMVPTFKDVRDAIDHGKYLLGIRENPPEYGRYTYLEKFEYLAIYWGIIVMGGSGLILWFPGLFGSLPRWILHIVRIAHTNEAFVAMLAVFTGHLFAVHLNPHVFPSSKVWLNGKISREHMKEEHPLEYKEWFEEQKKAGVEIVEEEHHKKWVRSKPLIIFELLVYIAVFVLLLVSFIPLLFV